MDSILIQSRASAVSYEDDGGHMFHVTSYYGSCLREIRKIDEVAN